MAVSSSRIENGRSIAATAFGGVTSGREREKTLLNETGVQGYTGHAGLGFTPVVDLGKSPNVLDVDLGDLGPA